jgi:hypothetical protein
MFSLVKLARGGLEAPEALQPRPGVEMATPRLPIAGSLVNLAMGGLEAPEALQPAARSVARPVVEMDTPRRPVASLVEMALGVFKPAVAPVESPTPEKLSDWSFRRGTMQKRGRPLERGEIMESMWRCKRTSAKARASLADSNMCTGSTDLAVVAVVAAPTPSEATADLAFNHCAGRVNRAEGTDLRYRIRESKKVVAGTIMANQCASIDSLLIDKKPWSVLTWSLDGTPDKASREVTVDAEADVKAEMAGSAEHLVQTGSLLIPSPEGIEHQEILVKPTLIENTKAGTLLSALQQRWTETGVHPMDLAVKVNLLFLFMTVDAASPNMSLMRWLWKVLPKNVILVAILCVLHQVGRIVNTSDEIVKSLNPISSLCKLMVVDEYYIGLLKAVAHIVRSDPQIEFGQAPRPEWRVQWREIALVCLGVDIDMEDNDPRMDDRGREVKAWPHIPTPTSPSRRGHGSHHRT